VHDTGTLDLILLQYGQIIDAVRIKDGAPVALKKISKYVHPQETKIGTIFSSEPLVSDPRNHCVTIQGTLQPPDDDDATILVMPLLHDYDEPSFDTFGEVIDFFQQVFKVSIMIQENSVNLNDRMSRASSLCTSTMLLIGMFDPLTLFLSTFIPSKVTAISATS
jgi:hypothetical protein